MDSHTASVDTSIWGGMQLELGEPRQLRIGPLLLSIQRLPGEWRVAQSVAPPSVEEADDGAEQEAPADLIGLEGLQRFAVAGEQSSISVLPALADRAVVTRPEHPFHLPAGEEVAVFVSTPLWVRLSVGDPPTTLAEIPVTRPSDTWFGPSTREGELCYAGRAFLRLSLDNIPVRPHRAVTTLLLRNRAEDELYLRALKLPVDHLALYAASDGRVWTQDITMERSEEVTAAKVLGSTMGAVRLRDAPPRLAPEAHRITTPRQDAAGNLATRAFSALFK